MIGNKRKGIHYEEKNNIFIISGPYGSSIFEYGIYGGCSG